MSQELPRYRSHKTVEAVKISESFFFTDGSAAVFPSDTKIAPFRTQPGWGERFKGSSKDPGYFVRYDDGYESWSPSGAFQEGYARVVKPASSEMLQMPGLAVGRDVHYHHGSPDGTYKSEPRTAKITALGKNFVAGDVSLCIFNPTGLFFAENVPYSETPKPGHWSWPPRV